MNVSVVIRCRNEEAHIGRLLTGVLRQRMRADEIVVVDSGSTDATLSIASTFPVRIVHLPPDEFSFGHACNVGCEEATGDLVVFVSAHCYPGYDTWLENLCRPFEDPEVGLSYGRQVGPPTAKYSEQRIFARWFPAQSEPHQTHPFCNNANAAVRRSVWEELRYDETLTGLEDLEFAKRLLAAGHAIAYVAEAPVVHVHDETWAQVLNRYRREALAHRQIFDDQSLSAPQALRLGVRNVVRDLLEATRERALTLRNIVEIPWFRSAQFYGSWLGFVQKGPVTEILRDRFFFPQPPKRGHAPSDGRIGDPIDYETPIEPSEVG